MNKNNDEIDLLEIFSKLANRITRFVKWLIGICNIIILFFIRNAIRLLIFILIGVGLAVFTYFSTERYYNTEMVLKTNAVSSTEMINYLNNFDLTSFIKNNSFSIKDMKISYLMDIDKDGQADYVDYKGVDNTDTSITKQRIKNKVDILISVCKDAPIDSIKNTIFSYINKNEYFQDVNNIRIEQLKNLIAKTDLEIQKLDSLETINYFYKDSYEKGNEKNMLILNEKEIKLFHKDILSLFGNKQSYEKKLHLNKNIVTIVQDFYPISKIENSITKKIKNFMIISFFIGLIFSIFIDQRKNLNKLVKRSKKQ